MQIDRAFRVTRMGAAVGALLFQAVASAAPLAIHGNQGPQQPSTFTLDFGDLAGTTSALISSTQFALELDAVDGTAQFTAYDQHIAPLTLPGGFSTGNLRVEVVPGSSTGTFDDLSGVFRTDETYAIYFDGDLSAFGLTSPVFLPGASLGTLRVDAVNGGNVQLHWVGTSFLPNPFSPGTFIPFEYTCSVSGAFAAAADNLVDLALYPGVVNLHLASRLEGSLLGRLDSARDQMDLGNAGAAVFELNMFIQQVLRQRGRAIPVAEADQLVLDAQGAIVFLGGSSGPGGQS